MLDVLRIVRMNRRRESVTLRNDFDAGFRVGHRNSGLRFGRSPNVSVDRSASIQVDGDFGCHGAGCQSKEYSEPEKNSIHNYFE